MPRSAVPARLRPLGLAAVAGGIVAVLCGVLVLPAGATNLRTDLLTETFTNATTSSPQWALPGTTGNTACLTAGTSTTTTPIKGCALGSAADAGGSGTLRLTGSGGSLAGSAFSTTGVPLAQGLDIRFNSYQWNGSGADGISFVLAATDPADPSTPAVGGATGEGLGYATAHGVPGVSYGYLGLGLDVYGNFAQTASDTSNGCGQAGSPVRTPEAVTVRGPGNGTSGYCVLGTPYAVTGKLDKAAATTRPVPVPVEVAVNPATSATTTTSGLTVPARSWAIQVQPYAGATTGDATMAAAQTVTGALPSAASSAPSSWVDSTGLPYLVTFGWAGSTGGSTETHEISGFTASTLNGPLAVYSLTATDDQNGQVTVGGTGNVTLTPHLGQDDGAEAAGVPVTVRATFPSGVTPKAGTFTTNGYSCTTTGATVVCSFTSPTSIPAGADLPAAVIPVTGSTAGTGAISAGVSSRDANPAIASRTLTVRTMTAQASNITYGSDETLSVSGLSGNATGTVAFTDASGTLCTATLPATSCAATRPAAGTHAVTATWQPASGSPVTATTTFVVSKASTGGTTMTVAPTTTAWGTGATVGVSGLDPTATGTISFVTAGGDPLCTATLPTTSCTTSATIPVGGYDIQADYSGDANHLASSPGTSYAVAKRTSTISGSASSTSTAFGSPVALLTSGLPTTGATAATGTIQYRTASGAVLCTATLPTTDCSTSPTLPVGTTSVTAFYSGDAHGTAAQSAPFPVTITRAPVSITAGPAGASVAHDARIPLSVAGLPAGATGSVSFTDQSGRVLCSFDVTQASSCSTPVGLAVGTTTVTAAYDGDGSYQPATAAALTLRVVQGSTPAFSAFVAAAQVPFGTAEVLSYSGLPTDATGSVVFSDPTGVLCTVPDVTLAAACTTARDLLVAGRQVTAAYSGDASYPATTATTAFAVVRAATDVHAATADATVTFGTAARLVAAGLPATATGTVRFTSTDGTVLCTVRLGDAAVCSAPSTLPTGAYRVLASYSGDDRYSGSTDSTSFSITRAPTALVAVPTASSVPSGTTPVLTFAGLDLFGKDAATGMVTFRSAAGALLCSVTLPGTACSPSAALPVGSVRVLAAYSGDSGHEASTATLQLDVVKRSVPLSIRTVVSALEPGERLVVTIGGAPSDSTGTVQVLDGSRVLCTIALPDDRCSVDTAGWALGRTRLTARFSGDDSRETAAATTTVLLRQAPRSTQQLTATTGGDGRLTASAPLVAQGEAEILQQPEHGVVAFVDGSWRYTASSADKRADSFTYRVVRPDGSAKVVTVTLASDRLAETGSTVVGPVGLGAALLGAGLLLLAVLALARRRRSVR